MSIAAIETEQLTKVFGDRAAVKGLTLHVAQGEVFGFLGPNGAGKTTSMKMLLGLVSPTSGSASLLGMPISEALPEVGETRPSSIFIEVVFPAPLGPRKPNTSPCATCRVRPFTAARSPKTFVSCSVSIAAMDIHTYGREFAISIACWELVPSPL